MSYLQHAKKEFIAAGYMNEGGEFDCDMQELICNQVLELLAVFGTHGHSGSSHGYALNLFDKLARFKALVPLSGDDDEWSEIGEGVYQNNRLSSVFKDVTEGSRAYDIDGRAYWEWYKNEDGEVYKSTFSKGGDRFYIDFPYEQKDPVMVFSPTENYPREVI